MASAGESRTVAAMACSAPATEVRTVNPTPVTTSHGARRCSIEGKWKNSAYSRVKAPPSQSPTAMPSTIPHPTITMTKRR